MSDTVGVELAPGRFVTLGAVGPRHPRRPGRRSDRSPTSPRRPAQALSAYAGQRLAVPAARRGDRVPRATRGSCWCARARRCRASRPTVEDAQQRKLRAVTMLGPHARVRRGRARRARGHGRVRVGLAPTTRGSRSLRSTSARRCGPACGSNAPRSSPAPRSRRRSPAASGCPPRRTDEVDVGSPFDYPTQALLYCAMHLPPPKSPRYRDAVADELVAPDRRRRRTHAGAVHELGGARPRRRRRARPGRRADPHPTRPAQAGAGRGASPSRTRRACSPRPACSRESTSRARRCRWSSSTSCRSRVPTTRCCRPAASCSARRRSTTIDVPRAATMLAQACGRLDPHRRRPRCRRRARSAARHGALPVGHRQGAAADAAHARPGRGRGLPARAPA